MRPHPHHALVLASALLAAALCTPTIAQPQPYPSRAITFVVPFPPGGPTDATARFFAQKMQESLKQPVVVENKPSVGGIVGMQAVAHAAPDGYTLILGGLTVQVLNRALYAKLPYDPEKDFVPVAMLSKVPYLLVTKSDFPASTVQDLVSLVKANPGKFNYGAPGGSGNTSHIAMEALKKEAGLSVAMIPYQGDAQSLTALMAGDVQMQFAVPLTALPHLASGRLKPIATAAPTRSLVLPNVPTFAEQGMPSIDAETWFSILAPAGTPRGVVGQLNAVIEQIVAKPETTERLKQLGATAGGGSLEEIDRFMQAEWVKWAPRVKDSGATVN